jgi:hypothetical protein
MADTTDHAVVFYQGSELAELAGGHLLSAIRHGGVAVLVARPAHRTWVNAWLTRAGVDLPAAQANGSYVVLDAEATIRRYLVNGWPDPAAFWQALSPLLASSTGRRGPVRVFGEMVALLWEAGLANAAIDVEALWNELGKQYPFSLLCGYPAAAVEEASQADALAQVCSAHSAVHPASHLSG